MSPSVTHRRMCLLAKRTWQLIFPRVDDISDIPDENSAVVLRCCFNRMCQVEGVCAFMTD